MYFTPISIPLSLFKCTRVHDDLLSAQGKAKKEDTYSN